MENREPILQAARIRDHLAAAAIGLLLWLPLAYHIASSHRTQEERLAREAAARAELHGALLSTAVERIGAATAALPLALQGTPAGELPRVLARLAAASGLTASYEITAGDGTGKVRLEGGKAPKTPIVLPPLPEGAALVPMGDAIWTVRPGELVVSHALFADDRSGKRLRFWGYASTTLSFAALAEAGGLGETAAGHGAYLRHVGDSTQAPTVLLDTRGGESAGAVSRSLPLPRNGQLVLDVEAPPALSPLAAALGWLACLLVLLPIYGLVLHLRVRRPGEAAQQADRLRAGEDEKAALQLEIDNRIHAERLLERSHRVLDAMFEHLPGMVVIKRASDLRISRINRSGEAILGRSRDLLVGRNSEEIHAPELAVLLTRTDYQAMAERRVVELPLQQVSMPGESERWVRFRKVALFDRHGDPEYVLEFGEDETERELLDRRLREHLNFLEQLLEAIPAPLFFKDVEGRYISVNSAFERFLGKSRGALAGKTVFDFCPPQLAYQYQRADNELIQAGGNQIYESSVVAADGVTREVMFHKAIFRATSGRAGGIVGIILDITERKQAETRVSQLNRILTVLSETSQAIVRIHDRDRLLHIIARLIEEHGGFPVAWVQLDGGGRNFIHTCQPANRDLVERLAAQAGCCPDPGSGKTICVHPVATLGNALAAELGRLGLHALVRLRLAADGAPFGAIGILASAANDLGSDEQRMLSDLADNISFALKALEEAAARRAVQEKLDLSARVFDNSTEGIVITDAENRILMVNKAFTVVTGYQAAEVIGRNPRLLSSGRQSPDFYARMWETLQRHGEWRGEIENRRSNGEIYPEWLNISVVRNETGEISNYVAVFSDLTHHKEIEARLDFLAYFDPLTSLPNRAQLRERVQQALARPGTKRLGLLVLDIDRFKLFNDSMGQQCGDRILLSVAERLVAAVPDAACVCRLGGDEFAILLDSLDGPEAAAGAARAIQRALRRSTVMEGHEIHLSVSQGISLYPEDGSTFEELAGGADTAMYAAIGDGGNTYRFFRQDMNHHAADRMRLESRLHSALDRREFEVFYQPLVSAKNGRIVGAEALLRWRNEELGGQVPPSTFIPLLEETGLIVPVGEWVLRTACAENRRWRAESAGNLFVAVNLSAHQLADDHLVGKIAAILADLDFPPALLEIELTESAVMRDAAAGLRTLQELKGLGVSLSIDDFGTGYSSLGYLRQLPLDTLKIDRSFVMDTPGHAGAASIVRAVVALGHSLQLEIVAEGVEDCDQVAFLRDATVDVLQGYHFSRPVPGQEFLRLVTGLGQFPLPQAEAPALQLAAVGRTTSRRPGGA